MSQPENNISVLVENLNVSYGDYNVLNNLSFQVKENEFFVIVGKSGSGKSTLLKAISELINYNGKIETKGDIKMVFQEDRLLPWLKIYQNIKLGFTQYQNNSSNGDSLTRQAIKQKIIDISDKLQIRKQIRKYPDQLSGGEKQRASIARAFISEPDIVLMDEPFKSLDIFTKENIYEWLLNFWQSMGSSIIYVTHDLEEALYLGDRVALLEDKQIIKIFEVPFKRPRKKEIKYTDDFTTYRKQLTSLFK